jgi:hypothetical protein
LRRQEVFHLLLADTALSTPSNKSSIITLKFGKNDFGEQSLFSSEVIDPSPLLQISYREDHLSSISATKEIQELIASRKQVLVSVMTGILGKLGYTNTRQ